MHNDNRDKKTDYAKTTSDTIRRQWGKMFLSRGVSLLYETFCVQQFIFPQPLRAIRCHK